MHEESTATDTTNPLAPEAPGQEKSAAAGGPASEAPIATLSLEERLETTERALEETRDAWLRAQAELENTRRRAREDVAKAAKFAVERFAGDLLPVKDSLEAALTVEAPTVESLKSGAELTLKQLAAAFEKSALKEIDPLGDTFNPHFHQAISAIESESEPNTVVSVLQKGYLLAERVVRPALVVVAKAKA
ncbi:MAG: nucleotide exchange factor GrpE [Candidatus Accumulibacter sp.]|jgi:molecular chaperone GrpE|nr:nucleotide exchange factor GrpE [Accumulibacter sp.]